MRGISVEMPGIRVGMQRGEGGNEGNKGENLCIRVELMERDKKQETVCFLV